MIGFAVTFAGLVLLGRHLNVDGGPGTVPVPLISPSAGIGLVWLATARTWRQLAIDCVVLVLVVMTVLALTDGLPMQIALTVTVPLLYLIPLGLLHRWAPHLWGSGGRASMRSVSDFGRVLLAMAIGVLVYTVTRTLLGELLIPEESLSLFWGRVTRTLSAMVVIDTVGLLVGGWLAEARDAGRSPLTRPGGADIVHFVAASASAGLVFYLGFSRTPEAPTTFLLTLSVAWVALRFAPLITAGFCLAAGSVAVWLTLAGVGPIAAIPDLLQRSLVAQVFVVVLMVLGMVISLSRQQVLASLAELARSEAANIRRAAELDLVMANLVDGVAIVEQGGRIAHANRALRTAFGTQDAEELHHVRPDAEIPDAERMIRGSDGEKFTEATSPMPRALAGESVPPEEWRTPDPNGLVSWVTISGTPLPPEEDGPPRALFVLRDISAEKSAQAAVEARAAELRIVIDKLNDGLAIVEEGGHYVQSNDALRRIMTGDPATSVLEGDVPSAATYHLHHPDGRLLGDDEYTYLRAIEGHQVDEEEYHLRRPGSPIKILTISAYPLPLENRDKRRAMVVVRDVTLERSYQDGLADFAGTVAHDLNNPLSVIDGWAEAIQEDLGESTDPIAGEARAMVEHIRAGVEQMRGFIGDLLAHAVARDQRLRCEQISLRTMVEHIATQRDRPGLPYGGIEMGDLPDIWVDKLLFRQVMDNLIGNAVKYVAPGVTPEVRVEATRSTEDWVEIRVCDNGIGIAPSQRERIFESFHRASKASYDGTGLGLAICKRILDRHGGHIRVEANPPGGSVFVFTVPATAEAFGAVERR